jgi:hypothetical protein
MTKEDAGKLCAAFSTAEKGTNMVTGFLGQKAWHRRRLAEMAEELEGGPTAKERDV